MKKRMVRGFWNVLLLVSTIAVMFITPFLPISLHRILYNVGFIMIFISSAFAVEVHRKFNIYFAVSVMVLDIVSTQQGISVLDSLSYVASLIFFLYMVARFIIQISRSKYVDIKVIAESITGYLLLGLVFAILIALTMKVDPNAISFPSSLVLETEGASPFSEYTYYSLVSLSTLGYGDILPKAAFAKSLMTFVTICGQFYMAIVVALLIGKFAATLPQKKS